MSAGGELIEKLRVLTHAHADVQKLLAELISALPEGEDHGLLREALEPYQQGVSLEFVAPSPELPTGAHFDPKTNAIRVAATNDAVDMAHSILFETYNARQREAFRAAELVFRDTDQTPLEYGKHVAEIEGITTEKYVKLLRLIRHHFARAPLSRIAERQLAACTACRTQNDFILTTRLTPHSTGATDHTSLMTPKMYAYEAVMNLGRLSASVKLKRLVARLCRAADWKHVPGLQHFGMWFSTCWSNTPKEARPRLWLYGGEQASEAFAHELAGRRIEPADLGFDGAMAEMAQHEGHGLAVAAFAASPEYADFRNAREA